MLRLILALALLCLLASPVPAGKNAGGALVIHVDDDYHPSGFPPPDVCGHYEGTLPDACDELVTTSEYAAGLYGAFICLVAALPAGSDPGVAVIYFGIEHSFGPGFISGWSFCGPPGSLEIPDTGWPEDWENAGNSLAFGTPIVGDRLFPFYWFGIYGEAGDFIGTRVNPTGGYAGFVSDDVPGVIDEIDRFGQLRWFEPGFNECPDPPPAVWACCFADGSCEMLTEADCYAAGGELWHPTFTCEPNICQDTPTEETTWGSIKSSFR